MAAVPFLGDDARYDLSNPWYLVRFVAGNDPRNQKAIEKVLLPPGSDFGDIPRRWTRSGQCLEVGGKLAFDGRSSFSKFRGWFRARVDNVHRRWPVVAVSFQDASSISTCDLDDLQELFAIENKLATRSPSVIADSLESGSIVERKRAAKHARRILRTHPDLLVQLLEHGKSGLRAALKEALALGPPYDRGEVTKVIDAYAHPTLIECLLERHFEYAFRCGDGVIESDESQEFLDAVVAIRDQGAAGGEAWTLLVKALETSAPVRAAALHLHVGDLARANELVRMTPTRPANERANERAHRAMICAVLAERAGGHGQAAEAVVHWQSAVAALDDELKDLVGVQSREARARTEQQRRFCRSRARIALTVESGETASPRPISSLEFGQSNVHVRGTISALTETRTVGARQLEVRDGLLTDPSGSIAIVFWNADTARVCDGDTVEVEGGYVGKKYGGAELQVSTGRDGILTVIESR